MRTLFALGGVIVAIYFAIWCLVVGAIGYVAWEILFDDALNRWFA